jgi:hypothetical protein
MTDEKVVKKCPFCGQQAKLYIRPYNFGSHNVYSIECNCGMGTPSFDNLKTPLLMWNRRPKDALAKLHNKPACNSTERKQKMRCENIFCIENTTAANGCFCAGRETNSCKARLKYQAWQNTEICPRCNGDMTVVADNHLGMVGCPDCGGTGYKNGQ